MKFRFLNAEEMNLATADKNITRQVATMLRELAAEPARRDAFDAFQKLGLPGAKHEEYRHTPITRELEKAFSFTGAPAAVAPGDTAGLQIPGIDANIIVLVNGRFSREHSRIISSPAELTIFDLKKALSEEATAREHFGRYIAVDSDAFRAWNAAGWGDGVYVRVAAGTAATTPVIIHQVSDARQGEVVAATRNLVVVEPGAQLTIVGKLDSIGDGNHFLNAVTEVFVGENAALELYEIQNDAGNRYLFNHTEILQKRSSRVNTYTFTLDGRLLRNNLNLVLDGEGIESHMYGLYLLQGQTHADNHTVVDHRKPNSFSNEMYKGVMDGSSKGVFNGKIYVRPHAQKTNAFQANRNILLSDKASINTKPQLEIWADDVKCSHGCTSGQLDEEALFYLRARGISRETAQAMMLYAFAAEVIEKIPHKGLREYIDSVVSERLHKNF